jgi:hypothetical protein
VAFSPDGKMLAARGDGATAAVKIIHLWEVATGKETRQLTGGINGASIGWLFPPMGKRWPQAARTMFACGRWPPGS